MPDLAIVSVMVWTISGEMLGQVMGRMAKGAQPLPSRNILRSTAPRLDHVNKKTGQVLLLKYVFTYIFGQKDCFLTYYKYWWNN